jgi:hypothetical protein
MLGACLQRRILRVGPQGWAPALHENIRPDKKCLKVTNPLAYYDTELTAPVKGFKLHFKIQAFFLFPKKLECLY